MKRIDNTDIIEELPELSPEVRIGNIKNQSKKPSNNISITIGGETTFALDRKVMSEAEKAVIAHSKRLISEYQPQNIVKILELAEKAEASGNYKTSFEIRRWIAEQTIGKAGLSKQVESSTPFPKIKVDFTSDPDAEDGVIDGE